MWTEGRGSPFPPMCTIHAVKGRLIKPLTPVSTAPGCLLPKLCEENARASGKCGLYYIYNILPDLISSSEELPFVWPGCLPWPEWLPFPLPDWLPWSEGLSLVLPGWLPWSEGPSLLPDSGLAMSRPVRCTYHCLFRHGSFSKTTK